MQQDTLRNMLIAAVVFLAIMWIAPRILPTPPRRPQGQGDQTVSQETDVPAGGVQAGGEPTTESADQPGHASSTPSQPATDVRFVVSEAQEERTVAMGSAPTNGVAVEAPESPYRMRLELSNVGASVSSATLTDHEEGIDQPERYRLLDPFTPEDGDVYRSFAIESITIDNALVRLDDKKWHIEGPVETSDPPGQKVTFTIDILDGSELVLRLLRSYSLPQATRKAGRHDVAVDLSVENLSTVPHRVILAYRGGVGVRSLGSLRWVTQFVDWGTLHEGRVDGARKTPTQIFRNTDHRFTLFKLDPSNPDDRLTWAATANTYFTCTVAPLNTDGTDNASYIKEADSLDIDESAETTNDVTVRFITKEQTIEPHALAGFPAEIYMGEKDVKAFKSIATYSRRNYYYQVSQGYGICTFTWLVELMVWLLNGFHYVVRDFGVAIIILVLIVRILLHPITKKGQVNMVKMQKKMQEMAPKIEEIKKKYANDKARLNQEMMKLNINPAGQMLTCLPMALQMPIWVALYISLSNNILIRHATSFLVPWVKDLAAQDALITFSSPVIVPIFGWSVGSLNLLPLLVAVFMYTNQKMQPKPEPTPNMSDKQQQQQDMMKKMGPLMSVMMLLIFYKMPAGLNLYIMTSSLFGTIEQKRIRRHIKEQEAAGTLLKPAPTNATGVLAKKKGKPSMLERLQKAVDNAQKMQSQKQAKPKQRR